MEPGRWAGRELIGTVLLLFEAGLNISEDSKNPVKSRVPGVFPFEYGLKGARRAPQFSKR
jgi:hypothetical protein